MLQIFSTFTGIGSFEIALRNLGIEFENVGTADVDRYAIIAYDAIHNKQDIPVEIPSKEEMINEFIRCNVAYNFSTGKSEMPKKIEDIKKLYVSHKRNKNHGDIRKIVTESMPDFDLFTYSFPCKNISTQGKGAGFLDGSETQSSLVWESERIIKHKMPKYLIMENVKNITSEINKQSLEIWIDRLKDIGYNSYYDVLDSANFELPQHRERFMMVSIRKDVDCGTFYLPHRRKNNKTVNIVDILGDDIEEKYFLSGAKHESLLKIINELKDNGTYNKIVEDKNHTNRIRIIGRLDYEKFESKARVFHIYGLSPTLDTMSGTSLPKILIDDRARILSTLECWRIMGMSDDDYYKVKDIGGLSYAKLHERAGRSIAIPMLEDIFKNLFLEKEKIGLFF